MDNFTFSLQALATSLKLTTLALLRHQVMWGFALGLVASTLVYAFVASENPRCIPAMMTRDERDAFMALAVRSPQGTYKTSFLSFQREYNKIRFIFYTALLAFLLVVAIALLRY